MSSVGRVKCWCPLGEKGLGLLGYIHFAEARNAWLLWDRTSAFHWQSEGLCEIPKTFRISVSLQPNGVAICTDMCTVEPMRNAEQTHPCMPFFAWNKIESFPFWEDGDGGMALPTSSPTRAGHRLILLAAELSISKQKRPAEEIGSIHGVCPTANVGQAKHTNMPS